MSQATFNPIKSDTQVKHLIIILFKKEPFTESLDKI